MSYEVKGKITVMKQTVVISERFSKREFVIEDCSNPKYPQPLIMQLVNDRTDLLDPYSIGDEVSVSVNVRCRSWDSPQGETKYFITLEAWRLKRESPGVQEQHAGATPYKDLATNTSSEPRIKNQAAPSPGVVDVIQMADDDDLPF